MNKTTKEIAEELGVDKQKVYRFIKKNHINEVHQNHIKSASVKQYDDVAQKLIKQGIIGKKVHQKPHHEALQNHINDAVVDTLLMQSEMMKNELDAKNEQIKSLQEQLSQSQKLLDQEQQLRMITEKKVLEIEEKKEVEKKPWWKFGKQGE